MRFVTRLSDSLWMNFWSEIVGISTRKGEIGKLVELCFLEIESVDLTVL